MYFCFNIFKVFIYYLKSFILDKIYILNTFAYAKIFMFHIVVITLIFSLFDICYKWIIRSKKLLVNIIFMLL